jgi:uncharacterized phage protein gp47/JayE
MNIKTRPQILAEMIAWLRNSETGITDFNPGSTSRGILGAVAAILAALYYETHKWYRASRIIYAAGTDLEKSVASRGMKRQEATKATVTVRFSGTNGTVIPLGSKIATIDGIEFETILAGTIGTDGNDIVDIACEAVNTGIVGRIKQGQLTIKPATDGLVSTTNIYNAEGGYDYETDEQLRNRAINQLKTLSVGTADSYEEHAKEADSSVLRAIAQYGHPAFPDRTVVVHLVKNNGGTFGAQERENIAIYIEAKSPFGITVKCINVLWTTLNIVADVSPEAGESIETIRDRMINNFQAYLDFREWDWGEDVSGPDLYALANNTLGVRDLWQASFTPAQEVAVGEHSLPKLGTITLASY